MIELLIANGLLLLNVYLIGFIIAVIINLVLAGYEDEDPTGSVQGALTWPLDVFYLIGIAMLIIKNKFKGTK